MQAEGMSKEIAEIAPRAFGDRGELMAKGWTKGQRTASRDLTWFLVVSSLFIILLVAAGAGVTSLLNEKAARLADRELELLETVLEVETRLERTRSAYLLSLPPGGEGLRTYALSFGFLANFSAAQNPVDWVDLLKGAAAQAEDHRELWQEAIDRSLALEQIFRSFSQSWDLREQEDLIGQASAQAAALAELLRGLREEVRRGTATIAQEATQTAALSIRLFTALGAFLLLLNGLLGRSNLRRLRASVRAIQADAAKTAENASRLDAWLGEMVQTSEEVRAGMEEATSAADQITQGSRHAAEAVNRLSQQLSQVEAQVQASSERLAETTHSVEQASEKVHEVVAQVRAGADNLRQGLEGLRQNLVHFGTLTQRLAGFRQEMREIHKIVQAMAEIAERTRVLSFNASIEAVRAGTAGQGFAVVAREIKALSESSRESAQAIGRIVDGLDRASEQVAGQAAALVAEVQAGAATIGELDTLFVALEESFQEVSRQGEQMRELAAHQEAFRDEVSRRFADAAAGIEEVSAQLEETAAAMEELHATAQQILGRNAELARGLATQRDLAHAQEALAAQVQAQLLVLDRPPTPKMVTQPPSQSASGTPAS